MILDVYRGSELVGSLDMSDGEPFFGFSYASDFLAHEGAAALSLSLPLSERRYSGAQTLPYFEGLLPEGDARQVIARRLGISVHSPAKLLRALGRDCAGDVMVVDREESLSLPASVEYLPLEDGVQFIVDNPAQELSRLQETYRLSLAGGQEKIALYHDDREPMECGWHVPLAGSPSTHILKPQMSDRYPDLALNEYLCMRTAALLGLRVADVSLLFPEQPLLVVKRYDRAVSECVGKSGLIAVMRMHQEDFCQALGCSSERKYESDGGPSIKNVRDLIALRSENAWEDMNTFVDMLMFNFLIGNGDAHAKNFSLLHGKPLADGMPVVRLAPAYDLLSTTIYTDGFGASLSRSMGMRMGEHFNIDKVTQADLREVSTCLKVSGKALHQAVRDLLEGMEVSLEKAAHEAALMGFSTAGNLAERIFSDTRKRAIRFGWL